MRRTPAHNAKRAGRSVRPVLYSTTQQHITATFYLLGAAESRLISGRNNGLPGDDVLPSLNTA